MDTEQKRKWMKYGYDVHIKVRPSTHVSTTAPEWAVYFENTRRKLFDEKEKAIEYGRRLAKNNNACLEIRSKGHKNKEVEYYFSESVSEGLT